MQELGDVRRRWPLVIGELESSGDRGVEKPTEFGEGCGAMYEAEPCHLCREHQLVVVDDFIVDRNPWDDNRHDTEPAHVHDAASSTLQDYYVRVAAESEKLIVRKEAVVGGALNRLARAMLNDELDVLRCFVPVADPGYQTVERQVVGAGTHDHRAHRTMPIVCAFG